MEKITHDIYNNLNNINSNLSNISKAINCAIFTFNKLSNNLSNNINNNIYKNKLLPFLYGVNLLSHNPNYNIFSDHIDTYPNIFINNNSNLP